MGQSLRKIAAAGILSKNPTCKAVGLICQGADELHQILLSQQSSSKLGDPSAVDDRGDDKKGKEIGPIIEECYDKFFADPTKEWTSADFYQAISETVDEINKKLGNTQFRVPHTETLKNAYETHHQGKGKAVTKEEFQKILQEVITDTGITGVGAKDIFFYIFGVPATALFIKQRVMPQALPNEIFIPGVTSATVFLLAKLNKI